MAATWHWLRSSDVVVGPLTTREFKDLAAAGEIQPADFVWRQGMSKWVRADRVRGLFSARDAAKRPPPLPAPEHRANETHAQKAPRETECIPPERAQPTRVIEREPRVFKELYDRIFTLAIPVTVMTVVIDFVPVVNLAAQLTGTVLLIVLTNMLLFKAWRLIQDRYARTTPGKAIGFRFIPVFSYYWEFVAVKGLAVDMNAYMWRQRVTAPPVSERLALWCCISAIASGTLGFVPFVGALLFIPYIILVLLQLSQVKDASIAIAEDQLRTSGIANSSGHTGNAVQAAGIAMGSIGLIDKFLSRPEDDDMIVLE